MWRLWHRAVEVNAWRSVINVDVVQDCVVCRSGARETALHCFWECKVAQQAWAWGVQIIQALADGPRRTRRRWAPVNWKQGIFSYRVPRRFRKVGRCWALICTTILWTIWIQQNDMAHNGIQWHLAKVKQRIWRSMVDYGRAAWSATRKKMANDSKKPKQVLLQEFQRTWCRHRVLASFVNGKPKWVLVGALA